MSVLLIADHDNRRLDGRTLRVLAAAKTLGEPVDVLVAGHACDTVASELALLDGVSRVRQLDAPHYADFLVENLAMAVAQLAGAYTHLLCSTSSLGRALAPRVAAMLDVAPVSDVLRILSPGVFQRPSHAGNVLETVECEEPLRVLTIHAPAFQPVGPGRGNPAPADRVAPGPDMGVSRVVARMRRDSAKRPPLGEARVVVAGGRGLGSAEAFGALLEPLADRLGAAIGASRAAVDAGFAPNELQVGQTGQSVAPELYLAIGISGAIQHVSGMREAACVVAINSDPDAPIFSHADFGLAGDVNVIVPALSEALRR